MGWFILSCIVSFLYGGIWWVLGILDEEFQDSVGLFWIIPVVLEVLSIIHVTIFQVDKWKILFLNFMQIILFIVTFVISIILTLFSPDNDIMFATCAYFIPLIIMQLVALKSAIEEGSGAASAIMACVPFALYGGGWWLLDKFIVGGDSTKLFWGLSVIIGIVTLIYIGILHVNSEKLYLFNFVQPFAALLLSGLVFGAHKIIDTDPTQGNVIDGIHILYTYLTVMIGFQLFILIRVLQSRKFVIRNKINAFFRKNGAVNCYEMSNAVDKKSIFHDWNEDWLYIYDYYDLLCEQLIREEIKKAADCGRFKFYSEMRPFLEYCKSKKKEISEYIPKDVVWQSFFDDLAVCSQETFNKIYSVTDDAVSSRISMITLMDAEQILNKFAISEQLEKYIPSVSKYTESLRKELVEISLNVDAQQGILDMIPGINGNPNIYQQPCQANGAPPELPPENTGEILMLPLDDEEDDF